MPQPAKPAKTPPAPTTPARLTAYLADVLVRLRDDDLAPSAAGAICSVARVQIGLWAASGKISLSPSIQDAMRTPSGPGRPGRPRKTATADPSSLSTDALLAAIASADSGKPVKVEDAS